jgi:hypothetical protein
VSGPAPLEPERYIRWLYIDRLYGHALGPPDGHPDLIEIPGVKGRGWCPSCASDAAAGAVQAGYTVDQVIGTFEGLVPPAYLDVFRAAAAAVASPGRTAYAAERIPRIADIYWSQPVGGRAQRRVAELAGVSRDTLSKWVTSGQMTWPPQKSGQESGN